MSVPSPLMPKGLSGAVRARERLITSGAVDDALLRPEIAESWRRCREADVSAHDLQQITPISSVAQTPLARHSTEALQTLAGDLSEVSAGVVVADTTGNIVSAAFCDISGRDSLSEINMLPGYSFAEASVGTNGIGTTLATGRPTAVIGAEHFNDAFQQYACVGLPLRHPISGQLIGVVEMTTKATRDELATKLMRHTLSIAKRRIEHRLLDETTSERQPLLRLFSDRDALATGPVLAYADGFEICNTWATLTLDVEDRAMLQRTALRMITQHSADRRQVRLHTGAECVMKPTLLMSSGLAQDGLVLELEFIGTSRSLGVIGHTGTSSTMRLGENYRRFADVQLLSGRSPLWLQTRTDLGAALRRRESVLAVGETGTGKTSAVDEIFHQLKPDGRSTIVEPEDLYRRVRRGRGFAQLLAGRPDLLILRNIHSLPQETIEPLAEFLITRSADVLVAATYNPSHMSDRMPSAQLLPFFQHTTMIPALRHRPDDIPGIVAQFLQVLAGDRQPLRVADDAMAALSQSSWPGNLKQLHDVLATLVSNLEPGQTVQRSDIPRFASLSDLMVLTAMEAIERDAIVQNLYECNRNKSATAQALGISRSSLYRKMRAYGLEDI
ncbi:GAF domain-containing protein [Pseudoclavibacter sp. CFCC 13796]|uniref:sigma-54-dependent Fis family transcriptional regulator n=1 Tax=Pseudoclavibacter sp. CFCC 13796 TaxID=2615179 RepID=UPI001300FF6C|nr:helix-turn-helix domain-containing protein [Pseudoclavibacter sp. CFCC 13796]KAB1661462.1 GAF domain-containing protein [Pseudoclavibacter sp. CFCC 13796]